MKEYLIDANDMDEKELNRAIKEHAQNYDKLIIDNPDSRQVILLEQWFMDQGYTSMEMPAGLLETT